MKSPEILAQHSEAQIMIISMVAISHFPDLLSKNKVNYHLCKSAAIEEIIDCLEEILYFKSLLFIYEIIRTKGNQVGYGSKYFWNRKLLLN